MAMKEAIVKLVSNKPGTSFVELANEIEGFGGEWTYCIADMNIIFWQGISAEAIDAIQELLQEGTLDIFPTPILTYVMDGAYLQMPIAKRFYSYKNPHWLPVTFSIAKQSQRETAGEAGD